MRVVVDGSTTRPLWFGLPLFVCLALGLLPSSSAQVLSADTTARVRVEAFRAAFFVPADAPSDVVAALRRFEVMDYHQGTLNPFGSVVIVGHPWSNSRPAFFLQHKDGVIERLYWSETEQETRAWDPVRGLRFVAPCPGGCLTTEVCLHTCPLKAQVTAHSQDAAKRMAQ